MQVNVLINHIVLRHWLMCDGPKMALTVRIFEKIKTFDDLLFEKKKEKRTEQGKIHGIHKKHPVRTIKLFDNENEIEFLTFSLQFFGVLLNKKHVVLC